MHRPGRHLRNSAVVLGNDAPAFAQRTDLARVQGIPSIAVAVRARNVPVLVRAQKDLHHGRGFGLALGLEHQLTLLMPLPAVGECPEKGQQRPQEEAKQEPGPAGNGRRSYASPPLSLRDSSGLRPAIPRTFPARFAFRSSLSLRRAMAIHHSHVADVMPIGWLLRARSRNRAASRNSRSRQRTMGVSSSGGDRCRTALLRVLRPRSRNGTRNRHHRTLAVSQQAARAPMEAAVTCQAGEREANSDGEPQPEIHTRETSGDDRNG
jgi:hypothetical protein